MVPVEDGRFADKCARARRAVADLLAVLRAYPDSKRGCRPEIIELSRSLGVLPRSMSL